MLTRAITLSRSCGTTAQRPQPDIMLLFARPIANSFLRLSAWGAQGRRVGVSCNRRCSLGTGVPVPHALAEVHAGGSGAAPRSSHVLGVGVFSTHCTRNAVVFRFLTRGGDHACVREGRPSDESAFGLWALVLRSWVVPSLRWKVVPCRDAR